MTLTCSQKCPCPHSPPDKTSTLFGQTFSLPHGHACSYPPPQVCSRCFPHLLGLLAKFFSTAITSLKAFSNFAGY